MQNKKSFLLFNCLLFFSFFLDAQNPEVSNNIELTIKDFPASKAYLCYYYGNQTFLLDSCVVDSSLGYMHFKSRKLIPDGMYFIAAKDARVLDFIIAGENNVIIKTNIKNL